jgi:hypothetical protein
MRQIHEILSQYARVAFEFFVRCGQTGRAFDVQFFAITQRSVISAVVPNSNESAQNVVSTSSPL